MNMPESAQPPMEQNWFDTMKIKLQQWFAKMNLSFDDLGYIAFAFVIGFATGFFLRKFGRALFILIIGALLVLALFNYFGVITVHWQAFQARLGITQWTDFRALGHIAWAWMTTHIAYVISGVIGFLIGHRAA